MILIDIVDGHQSDPLAQRKCSERRSTPQRYSSMILQSSQVLCMLCTAPSDAISCFLGHCRHQRDMHWLHCDYTRRLRPLATGPSPTESEGQFPTLICKVLISKPRMSSSTRVVPLFTVLVTFAPPWGMGSSSKLVHCSSWISRFDLL
jgi:hypothetical protein